MEKERSNPEEEHTFSLFQLDPVFLQRILARNPSLRRNSSHYCGSRIGDTPFQWEVQPGTTKNPPNKEGEPPILMPVKKTSDEFGFFDSDADDGKSSFDLSGSSSSSSLSSNLPPPPPPPAVSPQVNFKPWIAPIPRISSFWKKKSSKKHHGKRA
ncbi:hypothetical protein SLEP1_g13142 [Rubroshorea leprosula]|uniref:Uncharacterized protein n=1 Tax=Rubroshorea leprosula TaxID=152421 RepID=A0AAV5IRA0_9ROSI|nr:hypothetical protein SLEP1_g13142 [Rubroshorea leprosula]